MQIKQVVIHSPGPDWEPGVDAREQPGVMLHIQHYAKLHEAGKLLYGGPFTDLDSGGLMIAADEVGREELEAFAAADPAVCSGLLRYEVKTWYVAMAANERTG